MHWLWVGAGAVRLSLFVGVLQYCRAVSTGFRALTWEGTRVPRADDILCCREFTNLAQGVGEGVAEKVKEYVGIGKEKVGNVDVSAAAAQTSETAQGLGNAAAEKAQGLGAAATQQAQALSAVAADSLKSSYRYAPDSPLLAPVYYTRFSSLVNMCSCALFLLEVKLIMMMQNRGKTAEWPSHKACKLCEGTHELNIVLDSVTLNLRALSR
jgi:hypothetical protein